MNRIHTDEIVPKPSFLTGLGSLFNLFGGAFLVKLPPADIQGATAAVGRDFAMVGQDIRDVVSQVKAEHAKRQLELSLKA